MKKNILLICITALTLMTINNVEAHALLISESSIRPPKIHIYIDFGREPKCNRMNGICNFLPIDYGDKAFNYPSAGGYATYENGVLIIEVLESEMSDELNREFNSIHFLPIDIPLDLNPEILKSLMAPSDSRIQVGQYPISKIEGGYRIFVNLK